MMNGMSNFQHQVLSRLRPVLAKFGLMDEFREDGISERYLVLDSCENSICIWIYTDEVAYRAGDFHVQCEKQDFDSEDEMIDFFLRSLEHQMELQGKVSDISS